MAYYTQHYDPFRIAVSYFISAVAAHCAVITLDHERWRETPAVKDMELKELMRAPFWYASIAVGAGSIWAMHFLGMSALSLKHPVTGAVAPMQFAPGFTVFSVCIGVLCMRAGFWIMQQDVFATAKRGEVLKTMLHAKITNIEKTRSNEGKRLVIYTAFFSNLHYMFAGALLAALGVCLMHYCGMIAMWGNFEIEWSPGIVAASVIIAVVVANAGFWILFRLLLWKASLEWLRPACGAVIGVAVCCMHYTGMAAAKYLVVERTGSAPAGSFKVTANVVLALVIVVLAFVFTTERSIALELRAAYAKLSDTNLLALIYDSNSVHHSGKSPANSPGRHRNPNSPILSSKRGSEKGASEHLAELLDGAIPASAPVTPRADTDAQV